MGSLILPPPDPSTPMPRSSSRRIPNPLVVILDDLLGP